MSRMVLSRLCWAKAVSLSKVMDLRRRGSMRPNTASVAEIVSAAVFPVTRAASVTRDFRSCKTSTGRAHLQMMRSPSQWPASPRPSMVFGRSWIDARSFMASREALAARAAPFVATRQIIPKVIAADRHEPSRAFRWTRWFRVER